MRKGFTVVKDRRDERNAECTDYTSMMQWAMSNRPGAVPIGGGRKSHHAERMRHAYSTFSERGRKHKGHRKFDMTYKLGRYTPPQGGAFPNPGPSELALKRFEAKRVRAAGLTVEKA